MLGRSMLGGGHSLLNVTMTEMQGRNAEECRGMSRTLYPRANCPLCCAATPPTLLDIRHSNYNRRPFQYKNLN